MKKKNEMLEKLKNQPSAQNISSKIIKASEPSISSIDKLKSIEPSDIISNKYSGESLETAKKAADFDKNIDQWAEALGSGTKQTDGKLYNKLGKLLSVSDIVADRAKKSLPIIGTGLGLSAAKEAFAQGRPGRAAAELVSAIDPTPISDALITGYDINDAKREEQKQQLQKKAEDFKTQMRERKIEPLDTKITAQDMLSPGLQNQELKKSITPVIKQLGGNPDINPDQIKKLVGEQSSPDIEQPALNYEDYLQKQKKRMGY